MRLIALSERNGCSFFSATARSSKSLCFFRGLPRSERRRRYRPDTPSSFSRRHWRRRVRAERRFRRPLGSRRSSWLSCWKYRSRRRSGISPSSTGLSSEHQKTAQSSLLQRIKFDSEQGEEWMKIRCRSLMLPHENPDLVAKRGKNFSENTPSHSTIRCSSCRAQRNNCSRCGLRNFCGATAPAKRWQVEAGQRPWINWRPSADAADCTPSQVSTHQIVL